MSANTPGADEPEPSWVDATMKVALVARRLGVAPATLRTWARRYGLGPSAHTAGAHRQYSATDLGRLLVMRRLTLEGVAPAEAARIALIQPVDDTVPVADLAAVRRPGRAGDLGDGGDAAAVEPGPGDGAGAPATGAGEARVRWASRDALELTAAAIALDARACSQILDAALETHGVVETWTRLVAEVLVDLQQRWERATARVDPTPLLSDCVLNSVSRLVSVAGGAPKVLLACAEGEERDLGLHVLAAALWEGGTPTRCLGSRVPRETVAAVARQTAPSAAVVLAVGPVRDHDQLYALPGVHPAMTVVATGPGWIPELLPPSVAYVAGFQGLVRVLAAEV